MIRNRFLYALAAVAVFSTASQAQQVKDTADLFPPDSLLYFEVVKPAEISQQVAALTKGTLLEDMVSYMAKWREKDPNGLFMERQMLGMFSVFLGPEILAEFARLQGIAFAITGVNAKQEPDFAVVLLPGQSNFPGFVLRMIMMEMDMRTAAKVEGETVYGNRPFMFRQMAAPVAAPAAPGAPGAPPPPPPPPPPLEPPFIAWVSGAMVIGNSVEGVSDVVKRIKSKEKRPALSGDADFKEVSSLRRRAGLFTYANPGRAYDAILKSDKKAIPPELARAAVEILNIKSIRSVAANFALAEGSLDLRLAAKLEAGKTSPLLDLIADQRVSLPLFQPVPKDSIAAFSFALKDGEKHWKTLLAAVDATMDGKGPKPSEQVRSIEEKLKLSIGKEVVGRIAAVTIALPEKQELPKGATEIPMLFITGTDPGATERLEQLVAPLMGIVVGDTIDPVTQTIEGIKVRSLPGAGFPWNSPLHYGRSGTTLAIGIDRKLVAASLSGKIGASAIGDPKLVESLKEHDRAAAIGIWRWAELLPDGIVEMTEHRQWGPNGQPIVADAAARRDKAEKVRKSMAGLIHDMPPLLVSIERDDRQLVLRVQQRQSPGAVPKLVQDLFDGIMRSATNLFDAMNAQPAPPVPPVKN
jgi:hypothetical protein